MTLLRIADRIYELTGELSELPSSSWIQELLDGWSEAQDEVEDWFREETEDGIRDEMRDAVRDLYQQMKTYDARLATLQTKWNAARLLLQQEVDKALDHVK